MFLILKHNEATSISSTRIVNVVHTAYTDNTTVLTGTLPLVVAIVADSDCVLVVATVTGSDCIVVVSADTGVSCAGKVDETIM